MIRTKVILRDSPPQRNAPTDTGVLFMVGLAQKGGTDSQGNPAVLALHSLDDFTSKLGARVSWSVDYDCVETFFREGGQTVYYGRAYGPAGAKASANIAGTGTTLVITAKSSGDWANGATGGLTYAIVAGPSGGSYRQVVVYLNAVEQERTPEFLTTADAVTWSPTSTYVTLALGGGSGQPTVVGATNLTGGVDDHVNVTQTQVDTALALISPDLGPGQVCSPNWQTAAAHTSLLAHAAANNRYALCDSTDTTSKSTLLTLAASDQGNANGLYGSLLAPWLKITGTSAGTFRSVPPSAFVAAKCAETDASDGANQAPAGEHGKARSSLVLDVKATYSNQDQLDLQDAGVNVIINRYGGVMFDGDRSLVEPLGNDSEWLQMGVCRQRMSLVAQLIAIGQSFEHSPITNRRLIRLHDAATAVFMAEEQDDRLFLDADENPGSGFVVDTASVNTPDTAAARQMWVATGFRPAPGADFVTFLLSLAQPNQSLA